MVKRILGWLGVALVVALIALFWLNGTIDYSGQGRDYGLVEKWFFNGPVEDALFKSEAECNWEAAARYSGFVIEDLNRYGNRLIRDPSMTKRRDMVIDNLDYSIRSATTVDDQYFIAKGRTDLKYKYRESFIGGLISIKKGLESGDDSLVMEGMSLYNEWLHFVSAK